MSEYFIEKLKRTQIFVLLKIDIIGNFLVDIKITKYLKAIV
jgi:hypothetical protein